ncbi:MAG: hypothetical protein HYU63_01885 [Armatimonadetes bacterium]|nr:hypothetical protein [Armatimonadota bacterium]
MEHISCLSLFLNKINFILLGAGLGIANFLTLRYFLKNVFLRKKNFYLHLGFIKLSFLGIIFIFFILKIDLIGLSIGLIFSQILIKFILLKEVK